MKVRHEIAERALSYPSLILIGDWSKECKSVNGDCGLNLYLTEEGRNSLV